MLSVVQELQERARAGNPIRVAVVGAGWFGSGLIRELCRLPGMHPALVITRNRSRVETILDEEETGRSTVCIADSLDAVRSFDDIDLVYESTGDILYGAQSALRAIKEKKHFVTVNAEMDATVGYALSEQACRAGIIYTNSDGDQPGVIARMISEARLMGFEVTVAGNCKGFLDYYQTPDGVKPWVRPGHNVQKVCAFADGSKQSVELAVLANATGLVPDCRGMHGIRTTKKTLVDDFLRVIRQEGVVDFVLGIDGVDQGAGVFVIAKRHGVRIKADMEYLKKGSGPYYLFFRDYHLCYLEAPKSIAEAVLAHKPTLAPRAHAVDVLAVAKKDLKAGDSLDGIGGFTVYGLLDTAKNVRTGNFLPLGLSEFAMLNKDVKKNTPLTYDMVHFAQDNAVLQLRRGLERELVQ